MLIKNMEYLSRHLRCTDEEKDACLETVAVILHFWTDVRKMACWPLGATMQIRTQILFSAPACMMPSNW